MLVVGEWDCRCDLCSWQGKSSDLVRVEGSISNAHVLVDFMKFLQVKIAPMVGRELVRLGLIPKDKTAANIMRFTKILIGFSRAGFEAVLRGVLNAEDN